MDSVSLSHSASRKEEEDGHNDDGDNDGESWGEAEENDGKSEASMQDEHSAAASDAAGSSSQSSGSEAESEHDFGSESEPDSEPESDAPTDASRKRPKRDDPSAFATSLSKILHSKLSTAKRADPLLARSKVASTARREVVDARVEAKARHKLRDERRALFERGRVRDVLGVAGAGGAGRAGGIASAAEITERERQLKKIAQRGVVKLFNAVRAAQVQGEQAAADAKKAGIISAKDREARVNEMSKQGFLDLIAAGGARSKARASSQA
jgi:hypothetical protein